MSNKAGTEFDAAISRVSLRPLGEMTKGQHGTVVTVEGNAATTRRLLEMGVIEGADVFVAHEAPVSRDPIAIRVRGGVIALRRDEANQVIVSVTGDLK